jgi:hypothetical protein
VGQTVTVLVGWVTVVSVREVGRMGSTGETYIVVVEVCDEGTDVGEVALEVVDVDEVVLGVVDVEEVGLGEVVVVLDDDGGDAMTVASTNTVSVEMRTPGERDQHGSQRERRQTDIRLRCRCNLECNSHRPDLGTDYIPTDTLQLPQSNSLLLHSIPRYRNQNLGQGRMFAPPHSKSWDSQSKSSSMSP